MVESVRSSAHDDKGNINRDRKGNNGPSNTHNIFFHLPPPSSNNENNDSSNNNNNEYLDESHSIPPFNESNLQVKGKLFKHQGEPARKDILFFDVPFQSSINGGFMGCVGMGTFSGYGHGDIGDTIGTHGDINASEEMHRKQLKNSNHESSVENERMRSKEF
ncbi:hypothetical protein ABK040_009622 [Willaertia magna]